MGLDMYLEGRKYLLEGRNGETQTEDGFRLKQKVLELGYWRKEPNLHGYIVQTFADGEDKCQDIELTDEDLANIRDAVRERRLPDTHGFFFGQSADPNSQSEEERDWALAFEKETIEILDKAIEWLSHRTTDKTSMRWVVYRASW